MSHILFLALRYLRFHKVKTAILIFSIAVAIFLPLAVNLLVRDYQRGLLARAEATPLVAGGPGSRLDLVLDALYFRGKPARDLAMSDLDAINQSGLALGIPILSKHTARGFPIVGTSLEYFDFRNLRIAQGQQLAQVGECVLGAGAAEKLGLKPGDKLMSDPDNVFDLAGSYPVNMTVTGILAPTGGADDGCVFTDYKTEWMILGIMHGHADAATLAASVLISKGSDDVTVSDAVLPYQEVTPRNLALFHVHGDPGTFPVSAIIVAPHDAKSAAILRGRYEDPKSTVQLLVPREVVSDVLDIVFRVKRFFDAQAALVGVAMALLITLVLLLSQRLRRAEMETMFKLGCARRTMAALQAGEIGFVIVIGASLAGGLAWGALRAFHLSGSSAASVPSPVRASSQVAASNYPLSYFASRIAGGRVPVSMPDPTDIRAFQNAGLVLLNGAGYEQWRVTAAMPVSTLVDTSRGFADQFVRNPAAIAHRHGPENPQSAGEAEPETWLDPRLAALQAQSVHDALAAFDPQDTAVFDANLAALQKDLADLDAQFAAAPKRPLLAAQPAFLYLARRYGWDMPCVDWPADRMPGEDDWARLAAIVAQHPAKVMVWESPPSPAIATRLRGMGIEPVVLDICTGTPTAGDYLDAMRADAKRLTAAPTASP